MRILLGNSEPGFRGGEYQTLALASGLAARGWEVAIAARRGSALAERAGGAGSIALRTFAFEKLPIATPFALARFIASWRPHVLHAQTADAHTHLWIARAASAAAAPLVVSRRVSFEIRRSPFSMLKYRTGVAHYVPISRAAARTLARLGIPESMMTIIPSGIERASFERRPGAGLALRERWGIAPGDFVVGTVAAFEREKGHATLLDAAAEIVRGGGFARFVLVGEGSLAAPLAERARRLGLGESAVFAPQELPLGEILSAFDLFALPSLEEGLSTALLAAMASGLAVVASGVGGIPDAVSPECGILVPPGDARALAGALSGLVKDAEARLRMGEAGRRRAEDFDISMTVRRTVELYEGLVRAHGAGAEP